MENLTPGRAAVVRLLRDIIDEEIDKPETDMALVEECSAFMGELLDEQFPLTEEEIEARLEALKKKAAKEKKIVRKIPRIAGKIAVCASVLLVVGISTLGLYVNPAMQSWIVSMFGSPTASSNVTESITHMNVGESLIYSDMEMLIDKEGLEGILYPKTLPEDLEVNYIIYHENETDYSCINYNFTDTSVRFAIDLNCVGFGEPEEGDCIEPAGELTFVIKTFDNIYTEDTTEVLYHASAADEEGRYYIIESTSLEKVMGIIHQFNLTMDSGI